MKLRELIEELQDLASEHGDEVEVRIAYQSNYPLMADVDAVTLVERYNLRKSRYSDPEQQPVIFLAACDGNDYGSKVAWEGGVVEADSEFGEDEEA